MAEEVKNDRVNCVVLLRKTLRDGWEFVSYTLQKSVAWRLAAVVEEGCKLHEGHKKAKSIVVLREPYDIDEKRVIVKPPKDFELEPELEPESEPELKNDEDRPLPKRQPRSQGRDTDLDI